MGSAGIGYALQTIVTLTLTETLPRASRKAEWSWGAASPLSVLELFRRGRRLRVLACMNVLNEFSAGHTRPWMTVAQTQRDELLGWSPIDRGRYNSYAGLMTLPGFVGASRLIGWLGERSAFVFGMLGYLVELLVSRSAATQLGFFVAKPIGVCSYSAAVALGSRLSIAAHEAGMRQGELRGAIQNLQQLCGIVGPVAWGRAFAALSRRGRGSELYAIAAGLTALQLLLVPFAGLRTKAAAA